MIALHRLGHPDRELLVNHQLILAIEANPDTVIRLINGEKIVVADTPAAVANKVRACRAEVMALAISLGTLREMPPHGAAISAVPAEGSF